MTGTHSVESAPTSQEVTAEPAAQTGEVIVPTALGIGPLATGGLRKLSPRHRAAAIARLNAAGGNAAVSRLIQHSTGTPTRAPSGALQRDGDPGGGMSSSSAPASTPGTTPNQSTSTPEQASARKKIDDAIAEFSQGAFRDVPDWSLANADEKFKLLDKATALDLFWVGPRDEEAIERCWTSFGSGFEAAVDSNAIIWTRSIKRGADPENIPQTRGKYPTLKKDILAIVSQHLDQNEDRVVAEMGEFGLPPPYELLRATNPAKKGLGNDVKAPMLGGPTVTDRLREQSRLAKVLLGHKEHLKELAAIHVGLDLRLFDPGNQPVEGQDIVLWEGLTSWAMIMKVWSQVATEISLIENAWPALYAADIQGSLEIFAEQKLDDKDPMKAGENTNIALEQLKGTFKTTLLNIKSMRDKLDDGDADALDFTPVHRALWANQVTTPSGQAWARAIWLPVMNDDREVTSDIQAAAKFAIDAATMVAMVAGVIGTMGGAAIAIGVAGASALQAQGKSDTLSSARGAAVSDSSALVTKTAVDAASAEAEQKKLEFGVAVVTNLLGVGVEAAASRLNPAEMEKAIPGGGGSSKGESGKEIDTLRDKLNAGQPGQAEPAAAVDPAAVDPAAVKPPPGSAQAMKSWGTTPIAERPKAVADVVNIRLRSDEVPPIDAGSLPGSGGLFEKSTWTMQLDAKLFNQSEISESDFNFLIDAAYHEARHARQFWQIARLKAGDNSFADAAQFASKYGYKPQIAELAWAKPMASTDPLYAETQELFESFFGSGAAERNEVLTKINGESAAEGVLRDRTAALEDVRKRLGSTTPGETPTDLFDVRKAEMQVNIAKESFDDARAAADLVRDKYLHLPEEVQAYAAGGAKADWARWGLAQRARVRASEATLESAQSRLEGVRKRLASATKGQPDYEAADVDRALAEDDVAIAQADLAKARNYSALDTWNSAGTK